MQIFKTIRQTAATGILPEYRLRLMVAEGICPGIKTGNRFLINVTALAEMLDAESREGTAANVGCALGDNAKLQSELHAMKNELCQYCGKYKHAHEGACDGCKWREM